MQRPNSRSVFIVIVGVALLICGRIYLWSLGKETTDDAQVEGRLVNISPRIPGQISKIHVRDFQQVTAGDLLIELDPKVIVPGHGPVCGIEGAMEMKAYLQYVRDESRKCFEAGITSLEAAQRIEFGPYGEWRAPARLYMNVERAYREFGDAAQDAPWDRATTFDAIHAVARARGIEVEF